MLSAAFIDHVLATISGRTIGLVGDLFLDRYFDIAAALDEPSVETGLTAYQITSVRGYPGALGTVLNNLTALGVGRIHPITLIGDDGEGYELRRELAKRPGVVTTDILVSEQRRTPTYAKPMRTEKGATRELNRLDTKNRTRTPRELEDEIVRRLEAAWGTFDAVLVLDQVSEEDCGVVTARVRERIAELAAADPGKFVLADSREQIGLFKSVCVKPNATEVGRAKFPSAPFVFQTAGPDGIRLHTGQHTAPLHIPAYPVRGPIDICGAGDSCSAGIASAMTAGATPEQAAAFGNLVASITVQQIGVTGTATPEQVRARWREVGH